MPPKGSRAAAAGSHEDSKSETPTNKEKNGHGAGSHQSGTKLRRVASSAGSTLKDVTTAAALLSASQAQPPAAPEPFNPSVSHAGSFDSPGCLSDRFLNSSSNGRHSIETFSTTTVEPIT